MIGKTILVVDDEHSVREMIKSVLEIEGYNVVTAVDGSHAIEMLRRCLQPCLILLDMMMPNVTGCDFLAAVGGDPRMASIPVVLITASTDCLPYPGTVDCIYKPFTLKTLLKAVQRHCV